MMRDVGGNFGTRGMIYAEFALVGLGGATTRSAGQMDHRAPRVVPVRLPGARPRRRGRARARRRGQLPGDARLQPQQSRRPHHELLAAAEGRRDHVEHLPHAGRAFPRPRRGEQHLADAALPQRRAAGSDLCHRAADRSRRARARLRPRRDAPPQSRDQEGAAVQQSVRHGLRQRRLSSAPWTRRCGSATGTVFRRRRAAARRARQIPRHRGRQLCRHRDRRAARKAEITVKPDGRSRARDRHRLARPGPRDELRPAHRRMARRADRASASSPATPIALRSAAAPIPAAACGSARSSSRSRPTTSSRRARASPSMLLETRRSRHRIQGRPLRA